MATKLSQGTVHKVPADLRKALLASPRALVKWEDVTPLARNEWICWTTFPKQEKTRKEHVKRVVSELIEGMRRPCCWAGCPHRVRTFTNNPRKDFLTKYLRQFWYSSELIVSVLFGEFIKSRSAFALSISLLTSVDLMIIPIPNISWVAACCAVLIACTSWFESLSGKQFCDSFELYNKYSAPIADPTIMPCKM